MRKEVENFQSLFFIYKIMMFSIITKRFTFSQPTQILSVFEELNDVYFIAQPRTQICSMEFEKW